MNRQEKLAQVATQLESVEDDLNTIDGMDEFRERVTGIRMELVESVLEDSHGWD